MKLQIITPHDKKDIDVAWVELETPVGNFVIHSGHAPTVLTLLPKHSVIFRTKAGIEESVLINNGVVNIDREKVIIITDE